MSQLRDGADAVIKHHGNAIEAAFNKACADGWKPRELALRSIEKCPPGILSADELVANGKPLAVVISRAALAPASRRMSVETVTEWYDQPGAWERLKALLGTLLGLSAKPA